MSYSFVLKKLTAIVVLIAILTSCSIFVNAENEYISNDVNVDISNNNILENSYDEYFKRYSNSEKNCEPIVVNINKDLETEPIILSVNVLQSGIYTLGLSYYVTSENIGDLQVDVSLNGNSPFNEAKNLVFPHMWKDENTFRKDGIGNEFAPKQISYENYYYNIATDISKKTDVPYFFYLSAGVNNITLTPVEGTAKIEYLKLDKDNIVEKYKKPSNVNEYKGSNIVIEGEKPYVKSSYWLSSLSDNTSLQISPNSTYKSVLNYIGGDNWKTVGDTIVWETPELKEGYYCIGSTFRQSTVIGGKVYRKLTIDGKAPFEEANTIGFEYNDSWQSQFFGDDKNGSYLFYLSAGKHTIALTAVPGRISEVQSLLEDALSKIGDLYIDITMIVGENVDTYRDYDLFEQIPDMEDKLKTINLNLKKADNILYEITGLKTGSNSSVIKNMQRVIQLMLKERYEAHRYKNEYYNRYTALAAVLYEMQNMPLDIDKIILTSPGQEKLEEKIGLGRKILYSFEKFICSFTYDYNNISENDENSKAITVWVNWGRDQAQVLDSLAQGSFSSSSGIDVNVKLVNASVIQAILSGKGPDCILQHARTEPVNYAMRGVLYDLSKFDDCEDVLNRFQPGADTPYRYKNGLYALPDTQSFFLMFYRTDILKQLNISVPNTWDEYVEVSKKIASNNLKVWLPNTPVTDVAQANNGIGTMNIFPSLLLQRGLNLYSNDGKSTNLTDVNVVTLYGEWTDMYRKLKLPTAMDFYNRFRTGTCPIGIATYTLYTTLKAAAPEIDGLWSIASIPGTKQEDGTISHTSAGAGTACAILNNSKHPDEAWEFLKWWTSSETQLSYSNELEAILGPTGRIALSNIEALKGMDWDSEMKEVVLDAWSQVEELPEYPGSYYVSRSIYQGFWNVVENNKNPKDVLIKYGEQANKEIKRKWQQYDNR